MARVTIPQTTFLVYIKRNLLTMVKSYPLHCSILSCTFSPELLAALPSLIAVT